MDDRPCVFTTKLTEPGARFRIYSIMSFICCTIFISSSCGLLPIFPNLYENVIPAKPDIVWVGDITYIRIAVGFCYLAAILDACSRKVIGYAISRRIDSQLTLAALHAGVASRNPAPYTCIHHTDRGSQPGFQLVVATLL